LHIFNRYCRKAVQTLKRYALPQFTNHGLSLVNTRHRPDSRVQFQTENAYQWQFTGAVLSAGIVFFLAMAMSATTIRGVQRNILELAGVSEDLRKLAAHGSDLAMFMQRPPASREVLPPEKPGTPPQARYP
jgi:hypothetical protein